MVMGLRQIGQPRHRSSACATQGAQKRWCSHWSLLVTAVDQSGLMCRTPSRNDYCKLFFTDWKFWNVLKTSSQFDLVVIDKCASYKSTNIVDICRLHFTGDNVFGVPYFPVPHFQPCNSVQHFPVSHFQRSHKQIGILHSVRDLVCDVINFCAWGCVKLVCNVYDKSILKT